MAKKTTKGGFADKARKAHEAHKRDDTDYGAGGSLPEGIEGGVAQLTDIRIGTYEKGDNKGEPFFYAAGIVLEPKQHNGRNVEGLRTSIIEPLHDTPTRRRATFDDHYAWMLNEMRKLGVDTSQTDFDDIEPTMETLKEEQPVFGFRTWKGEPTKQYPNPRVNEVWEGIIANWSSNGAPVDDVVDNTDAVDDTTDEEQSLDELAEAADAGDEDAQLAVTQAAAEAGVDHEAFETWVEVVGAINAGDDDTDDGGDEPEPDVEDDADDEDDSTDDGEISLQDQGILADDGDEEAVTVLTTLAADHDLDPDEYPTWAELADELVILRNSGGDDDGDEDSDEAIEPDKGEVYFYKPPRMRKYVECEVTASFSGKRTCNLKNMDTGKLYTKVSWDALKLEAE